MPLLETELSRPQPYTVLCTVRGELDMLSAQQLSGALDEAISGTPVHVVVDLTAVDFMGSHGLTALVDALHAQRAHCHLALVVDHNRAVQQPLDLTGLIDVFDCYEELDGALRACESEDPPQGSG